MRDKNRPDRYILPKGYTPLPGFLGNPIAEGERKSEIEKFFDYEPGKCLVCGSEVRRGMQGYEGNILCSGRCRSALKHTMGYLGPDTSDIQRCPSCGVRMLGSLPSYEHVLSHRGQISKPS